MEGVLGGGRGVTEEGGGGKWRWWGWNGVREGLGRGGVRGKGGNDGEGGE